MLRKLSLTFLIIGIITNTNAQRITAKLLTTENNIPIPFATIQFSKNEGVMSNEEGDFEFESPTKIAVNDSLKISSLGFKTKTLSMLDSLPEIIYLEEEVFEIAPVVLTNKRISADEIIENVKENLITNYSTKFVNSQIFFRSTEKNFNKRFNLNLKKSTIQEIDKQLLNELSQSVPNKFTSFKEIFVNAYHNSRKSKIQHQKGLLMENTSEIGSTDEIQEKLKKTFENAIKPDSYLVFKTGIIRLGKTEVMDSMKKKQEISIGKPKEEDKHYSRNEESKLNEVLSELFVNPESEVNFLSKSNKYKFEKIGFVRIGDSYAFVLSFKPKSGAKYKGKLYVNIDDFAILRADIEGARRVFNKQFNMLGISANELSYKSTVMFMKNESQYFLHYYKKEMLNTVGLDRNFKIIEKNKFVKGRKKQNVVELQFDLFLENQSKIEIAQSNLSAISEIEYSQITSTKDFKLVEKKTYPKDFWNGYNILTPEKAIRELKIED